MDRERLKKSFARNGMEAYFVGSVAEVCPMVARLIPERATVGCGDSVTLEEAGVFAFLRGGPYVFYDKHAPGLTGEDKRALYIQNFSADTFVTGANAVTEDGALFNIDGNGSRVAPMLYGPRQVIVVAGANKLVPNVAEAIERTRQVAAPLDARRLGKATPCAKLGRCVDCRHEQRICNDFVLITGQFQKGRIKLILVEEELGY